MTQRRPQVEGSYRHLDTVVVACLQGRADVDASVQLILAAHAPDQIQAVLLGESERYRRFSRTRFTQLAEALRLRGVLW